MDRNTAMQAVKLILRFGFNFVHKDQRTLGGKKKHSGHIKVVGRNENAEAHNPLVHPTEFLIKRLLFLQRDACDDVLPASQPLAPGNSSRQWPPPRVMMVITATSVSTFCNLYHFPGTFIILRISILTMLGMRRALGLRPQARLGILPAGRQLGPTAASRGFASSRSQAPSKWTRRLLTGVPTLPVLTFVVPCTSSPMEYNNNNATTGHLYVGATRGGMDQAIKYFTQSFEAVRGLLTPEATISGTLSAASRHKAHGPDGEMLPPPMAARTSREALQEGHASVREAPWRVLRERPVSFERPRNSLAISCGGNF
ncbi:hypothetical protein ON010_g2899 [Phytophthora cinnamomi]|nr:hypothetical protein ON010_g2899 [Phytophthora cinnamomi]